MWLLFVFFFKQKTAYEMRISDWSSDVCPSDLDGDEIILGQIGEDRRIDRDRLADEAQVDVTLDSRIGVGFAAMHLLCEDEVRVLARNENGRASCRERVCQYV